MTDPEAPRPPGAPDLDVDLPVAEPEDARQTPGNEDVEPAAGATEPPD
jgi:hypothetical protein